MWLFLYMWGPFSRCPGNSHVLHRYLDPFGDESAPEKRGRDSWEDHAHVSWPKLLAQKREKVRVL